MSPAYLCPMHGEVRQADPGRCARCGMVLVREGTRFRVLRHMVSSPRHVAAMIVLMLALMAAAMVLH